MHPRSFAGFAGLAGLVLSVSAPLVAGCAAAPDASNVDEETVSDDEGIDVAQCAASMIADEDGTCVPVEEASESPFAALATSHVHASPSPDPGAAEDQGVRGDGTEPTFGVFADRGRLTAKKSSRLYGRIAVRKSSWSWSFGHARQASTNRTQKSPVFRANHWGDGTELSIVDPSCSAAYPCAGGVHEAAVVWERRVDALSSCLLGAQDGLGDFALRYIVASTKTDTLSPPHWSNRVYLYDFCRGVYVSVYSHTFRASQRNCSTYNDCGYALATVSDQHMGGVNWTAPEGRRRVVFSKISITNDGVASSLSGTADTHWVAAPAGFWQTHLTPDYAYTALRAY